MMRSTVLASLLIATMPVQAALVDNGSYTTDTAAGLDWLDLPETAGMTMVDALSAHAGWRYATNAEINGLFAQAFDGYYATNAEGFSRISQGAYADQAEDMAAWVSLFGANVTAGPAIYSNGFYFDDTATVRMLGTY